MSFLRLGVQCAVLDDEQRVLLSRRADLNVWTLPGGRLDAGELFTNAAVREVREETGVFVHIERAVGLYYWAGWRRLNVVYAGWPLGGEIRQRTPETHANRYFEPNAVPVTPWSLPVLDALAGTRHKPRVLEMSPAELRQTKLKLRWRWVKNALTGRSEPHFAQFDVSAVAIIWDDANRRVLTLPGARGRTLPRAICQGALPPWQELADTLHQNCGIQPALRWVGLWQDASRDNIEFVFAATMKEAELFGAGEWSIARNCGLDDRDAAYVARVKPSYARDAVWTIVHEPDVQHGETVAVKGEPV
jgi:ADP-ribose pyrophosphatase YjhB (NUDIX family)